MFSEQYHTYTERFGQTLRQIGFAGLAIVWLFKVDIAGKTAFPQMLVRGAWGIAFSLALDLLDQFIATVRHAFSDGESKGTSVRLIDCLSLGFLVTKFIFLSFGYYFILT